MVKGFAVVRPGLGLKCCECEEALKVGYRRSYSGDALLCERCASREAEELEGGG